VTQTGDDSIFPSQERVTYFWSQTVVNNGMHVLTHHAIRALLRLKLTIQTLLQGSYMRKTA